MLTNLQSFESSGTTLKQLTFSEFCGAYETEGIEGKFVEYLKLCYREWIRPGIVNCCMLKDSILAREKRQEYTLNPLSPSNTHNVSSAPPEPPHPLALPAPLLPSATGPVRVDRVSKQARLGTGPLLRRKGQASAKTADADLRTILNDAPTNPSSECTDKAVAVNVGTSSDATNPNPDVSNDESHLSGALDDELRPSCTPDVEMEDSGLVITVNDDALAVTAAPTQSGVETRFLPLLGVHTIVESESPALLSVDGDVCPDWLLTVTKKHLPFVPYLGCLGKVVDLFLAQEARLGYPNVVSVFTFYSAQFTYSHPQVQARGPHMC